MFTTGAVFCGHDLSAGFIGQDGRLDTYALAEAIAMQPLTVRGSADAGTLLAFDDVHSWLGRPPVLIVMRALDEVAHSLARVTGWTHAEALGRAAWAEGAARKAAQRPEALTVDFEDLDREEVMRAAWRHLTKGLPFPLAHFRKMVTMRVEIHPDRMAEAARRGMALAEGVQP